MAPCLRVFCLLLICASIVVNVEPRYTANSSKSVHHTHTEKRHQSVYEPTSKQTRHIDEQVSRHTLSGGPGYPSGSRTQPPKTGNHGYPSSHGKSGNGPVTNPPAIERYITQPPYRPPALEPFSTQTRHTGSQAIQNNIHSGGSGYPSGTQPPETGNQVHGYPNSQGKSGAGPVTNPPTAHNLYPQTTQASHQYPTNVGLSGGSNTPVQQPALQSSSYPSANGLSGHGHIQQSVTGTQLLNNGNQGHGYPNSQGKSGVGSVTSPPTGYNPFLQTSQKPPVPHSYPTNGGLSGGSNNTSTQQLASYPTVNGLSVNGRIENGYKSSQGSSIGSVQTSPKPSAPHSYPTNGTLSGGSGQILLPGGAANVYPSNGNKLPPVQTHSYPTSNGQSGGGYKPVVQHPRHTTHVGDFEPNNNHIYIRDRHTPNIHSTNIQTTHIHIKVTAPITVVHKEVFK